MSRLPRPPIPLPVKVEVALTQLGEKNIGLQIARAKRQRRLRAFLNILLERLATHFGCTVADLHLDHDPALVNREKSVLINDRRCRVVVVPKGATVIRYYPDANDPEHLRYRPKPADAEHSHDVKTRIRGDHGQHSDLAMARKNKNIARNRDRTRRRATIKSANRWPPKGSRLGSCRFT